MKVQRRGLRRLLAFALFLTVACGSNSTNSWACRVAPAPDAFEIVVLPTVLVTSRIVGFVRPAADDDWSDVNEPVFEIWPYPNGSVATIRLNSGGQLPAIGLPHGRYCFRASAKGFSSVTGRIEVNPNVSIHALQVHLPAAV